MNNGKGVQTLRREAQVINDENQHVHSYLLTDGKGKNCFCVFLSLLLFLLLLLSLD